MDLAVVVFVVAGLGWALVEFLAVAGLLGAVAGERMERCQRCRHYGLTEHGAMHPNRCPQRLAAHLHDVRVHLTRHLPHLSH